MTSPATHSRSWREQLAAHLDPYETRLGAVLNVAIAFLAITFSVLFVVETYPISAELRAWLRDIDTVILILFSIEYLLRLSCSENKLRFVFSLYGTIDLLAIVPLWAGFLDMRFIRFFSLLRGFRILRLARFLSDRKVFGTTIPNEDGLIALRILYTLFAIIFVYTGLIFQVEHPANPTVFRTFLDAFYFAVATMTTVGFGDVTPVSESGRLLTVLMIMTGIAVIPWQLGDLVQRLVRSRQDIDNPCPSCGVEFHQGDAKFCRRCGTQLHSEAIAPRDVIHH